MTTTTTPSTHQISLPGQSHAAEGPHDHTGMYVMHFGLRRDLASLASAVANTPLGDTATWRALHRRWQVFADILHHHHTAEDDYYWPVLAAAVAERGTPADQRLIDDMEGEHAAIDPALTAVEGNFTAVLAHPCIAHRDALEVRVATLREALDDHLAHEERETLPLVQRVMSEQQFAQVDAAIGRAYPPKLIPTLIPWVLHRAPDEAAERVLQTAGPAYRLLFALTRGRFARSEQAAFRFSDVVLPG